MSTRPPAVILRLKYGGYGIVRSLSRHGIPMIGFERDLRCPEAQTKLCEVRAYQNREDLQARLLAVSRACSQRPVLYLTNDSAVEFCADHFEKLRQHFRIDFAAEAQLVETLLHKDKFAAFAKKHGFNVPRGVVVRHEEEGWAGRVEALRLPCVLKPYKRSPQWKATGHPKAKRYDDRSALMETLRRFAGTNIPLVVQEWIPGADDAVHFCLAYYSGAGECLSTFTGRKLRQWPPATGTTSAAEPRHAPAVTRETRRLFDLVSYKGFGSVEFKKHARTGEFFITEPTVGRVNQQSFVATANGVNLPLLAYQSLTGERLPCKARASASRGAAPPTVYIDEEAELRNLMRDTVRGRPRPRAMLDSYGEARAFRYFTREDMRPFMYFLRHAAARLPLLLAREIKQAFGYGRSL